MFTILKRNVSCLAELCQKVSEITLVGRDLISPRSFTPAELQSLLWTALDLKHVSNKQTSTSISGVQNTKISLLLDKPSAKTQLPLSLSSLFLQSPLNTIVDCNWKNDYVYVWDYGRLLATTSDIIFCHIKEQKIVKQIADGANVPVVNINSSEYNLIKTLADLMTAYEHFYRLKYLTVAYVGKSESLFNSYLMIVPQFKMNFRYCLVDAECNEFCNIEDGRKYSQQYNTEMHELWTPSDACRRADIICTSTHHNADFQLCKEDIQEAAINWIFLHELPRGECDVEKAVFNHKNSFVWKSVENLKWIYSALIMRLTVSCYNHVTQEPAFDADEFVCRRMDK